MIGSQTGTLGTGCELRRPSATISAALTTPAYMPASTQLTNKDVSRLLKETASLIELTGGNEFRARSFSSAARTIERLDEPISTLMESGSLQEVRGIGSGLAAQIQEILQRGTFALYDDLLSAIPPGLTDILRVKGLGAKKVRRIWQTLGITNLRELEEAANIGRLADLDGFGVKTQENVLANIQLLKRYGSKRRYAHAVIESDPVLEHVQSLPGVDAAQYAGELRRKQEVVSSADIVVGTDDPAVVSSELTQIWALQDVGRERGAKLEGSLPDGLPLTIHVVRREEYGSILWRLTGSADHVDAFESQFGPAPKSVHDEAGVFAKAGLPFIPPELRENLGEFDAARTGILPDLIAEEDLRGTLHNHSTYSDGAHTIRQMVDAARSIGYSYYGVCDHSRSLVIANGLPIERLKVQQAEIDSLNEEFARADGPPFRIFKGTESDILEDGSLDYPPDVLASFDMVVASIHQGFNMTEAQATKRLVRAIENPFTTILGHPTGRLLLRREGYPIDHERVIDACAEHDVVIEINANPRRLDIDWRWVHRALDRGVMLSINPDAHSIDELYYVQWGIAVARKGWLTPEGCLNAKPLEEFSAWIEERKSRRAGATQI